MEYILTYKNCNRGSRWYKIFFLNNVKIFKQNIPFDESIEAGFNAIHKYPLYLLNNVLYMERKNGKIIKYPISKKILEQFNIPRDLKIIPRYYSHFVKSYFKFSPDNISLDDYVTKMEDNAKHIQEKISQNYKNFMDYYLKMTQK